MTDLHGGMVQNAAVVVKNESSGRVQHAATDNQGHFAVIGIPAGNYDLTITAPGFATVTQTHLSLTANQTQNIPVQMKIGTLSQVVEVEAIAGNSIAPQHALSQDTLDTEVPKSEISNLYIKEFTPPTTDYAEIVNIAPGTNSYNSNGVGLGQGTIYFRGFIDGDFDLTWDGIPEAARSPSSTASPSMPTCIASNSRTTTSPITCPPAIPLTA